MPRSPWPTFAFPPFYFLLSSFCSLMHAVGHIPVLYVRVIIRISENRRRSESRPPVLPHPHHIPYNQVNRKDSENERCKAQMWPISCGMLLSVQLLARESRLSIPFHSILRHPIGWGWSCKLVNQTPASGEQRMTDGVVAVNISHALLGSLDWLAGGIRNEPY